MPNPTFQAFLRVLLQEQEPKATDGEFFDPGLLLSQKHAVLGAS